MTMCFDCGVRPVPIFMKTRCRPLCAFCQQDRDVRIAQGRYAERQQRIRDRETCFIERKLAQLDQARKRARWNGAA